MTTPLLSTMDGPVRVITLNRPDRRNALNPDLLAALAAEFAAACADPATDAVVLAANGPAFCAGGDFSVMAQRTVLEQKQYLGTGLHRVAATVHAMDKPFLVAIQGPAVGAGVDLCTFADVRLAGEAATFFFRYAELGLVMGDGAAWFLPRIVGESRALELAWSAAPIDAPRAREIGLVSAVYPGGELLERACAEAHRLAALPTFAVRTTKRLIRQAASLPLDTALELSSSQQALAHATDERQEAARRFAEQWPG